MPFGGMRQKQMGGGVKRRRNTGMGGTVGAQLSGLKAGHEIGRRTKKKSMAPSEKKNRWGRGSSVR